MDRKFVVGLVAFLLAVGVATAWLPSHWDLVVMVASTAVGTWVGIQRRRPETYEHTTRERLAAVPTSYYVIGAVMVAALIALDVVALMSQQLTAGAVDHARRRASRTARAARS